MTTKPVSYDLQTLAISPSASAAQNACKLCAPLGAALVFKGIAGAVPLLHGSQGCSTYIRRYLISHFKEPVDIACSNFGEQTAIFGGGANLRLALDNVLCQYAPSMVGVATTCLSETIGDDMPMLIRQYREQACGRVLPPIVHVSTPSYQGSHMEGFHRAVHAVVEQLARELPAGDRAPDVALFPGLLSPEDLRQLKAILAVFGLRAAILPDYSRTLDGPLWQGYERVPAGGVDVEVLAAVGGARAAIELGRVLAGAAHTAATLLQGRFNLPVHRLGLPIGIRQTDSLLSALAGIAGRPIPESLGEQRGRLLDTLVDHHKLLNGVTAALYGEEDLVAGLAEYLSEIGIVPVVCASGGGSGRMGEVLRAMVPQRLHPTMAVKEKADFAGIEAAVEKARPDLIIGHSKGYAMSRRLGIPLVRVGFPIHDRPGGARLLHVGYAGALSLFDRIAEALISRRQETSPVGYTYIS